MGKSYGRGGQATDGDIIQRMRTVQWVTEGTETQKEYVNLFILYCQNFYVNAPK
jgi:hypothetical protein